MTREEATFYIKELQKTYASMDKKVAEAVDMAIEALSAERTGEWAIAYLDHESIGVRPKALYCSECSWLTSFPSAYCPNCGAKME